jgi:hypothetical protein
MHNPLQTTLLIGGAALATWAAAQPPAFADLDDAKIENAFWHCDVQSMQVALEPGDGVLCERLTDALKQRRFDGDFTRLLAWWQAHKAVEHARRGLGTGVADARDAQ